MDSQKGFVLNKSTQTVKHEVSHPVIILSVLD